MHKYDKSFAIFDSVKIGLDSRISNAFINT